MTSKNGKRQSDVANCRPGRRSQLGNLRRALARQNPYLMYACFYLAQASILVIGWLNEGKGLPRSNVRWPCIFLGFLSVLAAALAGPEIQGTPLAWTYVLVFVTLLAVGYYAKRRGWL
jgi:hypothetical protein